ncbi:MAG: CvpA family protein [Lentisphaeria bacterium]|nr:CvpA family protein [Lentisphaeria bacterium]
MPLPCCFRLLRQVAWSQPYDFPEEELLPDFLIENTVSDSVDSTLPVTLDDLLSILKDSPIYSTFSDAIGHALENGQFISGTNVIHSVANYIAFELTSIILFALFFVFISIVWFLLSHALNLAFHLPVLSTLNHWSGALLGLFQGAFLVWIISKLLLNRFLTQDLAESTFILQYFCNFDPFLFFSRLKFITSSYL